MENKLLSDVDFFNDINDGLKFDLQYIGILCDIACHVTNYRLKNNITQKEFANKLKISKRKLMRIENAECNIKLSLLFRILNKIDMKIKICQMEK